MASDPRRLNDFAGQWHLSRNIAHADGTTARFDGTAIWFASETGMTCVENGLLTISQGLPMTATRRYMWRDDLSVWFEDGRFFHKVPPQGGATGHWCDPDQYDGFYDFQDWPVFRVRWQVTGPSKSYCMDSTYQQMTPV